MVRRALAGPAAARPAQPGRSGSWCGLEQDVRAPGPACTPQVTSGHQACTPAEGLWELQLLGSQSRYPGWEAAFLPDSHVTPTGEWPTGRRWQGGGLCTGSSCWDTHLTASM